MDRWRATLKLRQGQCCGRYVDTSHRLGREVSRFGPCVCYSLSHRGST